MSPFRQGGLQDRVGKHWCKSFARLVWTHLKTLFKLSNEHYSSWVQSWFEPPYWNGPQMSLCWAHGLLLVPCAPMSIVCPLPSCYLIIVSVAPPVSKIQKTDYSQCLSCKLPYVSKGVNLAWSKQIQIVSSYLHFGGCWSWAEYLRKCWKKIRVVCSQNEPIGWSLFAHFILCIFLKTGMLTFRFIFEILMLCIDLISLNWLYNWHYTYLPDW